MINGNQTYFSCSEGNIVRNKLDHKANYMYCMNKSDYTLKYCKKQA